MDAKPLANASVLSTLLLVFGVNAQQASAPDAGVEKKSDSAAQVHEESPRAEVNQFLEDVRTAKDGLAAEYLELSRKNLNDGAELADQLAAVLQGDPTFEVDALSAEAAGNLDDGLPPNQEDVAHLSVGGPAGTQPVRMVKHTGVPAWRFSAATVAQIPAWYERTPKAWAVRHLPPWCSKRGPAGVQFWQWAALLLTALLAWVVGFLAGRVLERVATRIVKRTKTTLDDEIVSRLQGPLTLVCSLAVANAIVPLLDLPESTGNTIFHLIRGGYLAVVYWLCIRGVDLARTVISRSPVARNQPASRSLISLGSRFTKALLFVILVIAVLSQLGFPVASLLAGLGIGGLAVALAGQKTLENLIGTFAIGFDQPFREGDFVKVRDFMGTVEMIGLRSTRFRTLDRTVISLPNGKLADEQIETFAPKDRFRLFLTLPIRYGATAEQLQRALTRLESELKQAPKVDVSTVSVKLASMNDWSMAFEVLAMVDTVSNDEFNLIRQNVLLQTLRALDELGVKVQPTLASVPQAKVA